MNTDQTTAVVEIKLIRRYFMQQTKSKSLTNKVVLAPMQGWGLEEQLEQYSTIFNLREALAQFYDDKGFNISQIAKKLGISRVTVYDWLDHMSSRDQRLSQLPVLPDTEELIDQWEKTRHIWLPIIYSKDIQIKI